MTQGHDTQQDREEISCLASYDHLICFLWSASLFFLINLLTLGRSNRGYIFFYNTAFYNKKIAYAPIGESVALSR